MSSTGEALQGLSSASAEKKSDQYLDSLKKLKIKWVADAMEELGIKNKILKNISLGSKTNVCGRAYTVEYRSVDSPIEGLVTSEKAYKDEKAPERKRTSEEREKLFGNNRFFLDQIPENENIILVIDGLDIEDTCAVFDGLEAQYAKKKGIKGAIINGNVRDSEEIEESGFPVFHRGSFCVSSAGKAEIVALQKSLLLRKVSNYPCGVTVDSGDYILAGPSGTLIISPARIKEVVESAEANKLKEEKRAALIDQGLSSKEINEIMPPNKKPAATTTLQSEHNVESEQRASVGLR